MSFYYFCFLTLIAFGILGLCVGVFSSVKGAWALIPVGVFSVGFFFYILKLVYMRYRPIELDDKGISAVIFRDMHKTIFWKDVKRIERIKGSTTTDFGWRFGYSFVIVGGRDKIIIEDKINGLPELLNSLNACVQNFHIPLVAFDRTDEAKAKIRASVKDEKLRKKLMLQGEESSISKLTPVDSED